MSREVGVDPQICVSTSTSRERALAEIAGRQHGVVSRGQLAALGFDRHTIDRMLARGRLHLLHRGVYAVGHRVLSRSAQFMGACLATGGVLSHRSAGALLAIARYDGPIEITVPTKGRRRRGLLLHCAVLQPDETGIVDGIPITTTPRTLLDLAAVLPRHRLERAVGQAEVLRLTDDRSVADLLARHPGRRGAKALRELTDEPPAILASELEHRFLALTEQFGLPRPTTNTTRGGHEVDALYPRERLMVELDGRTTHATRRAFETDRARDRRLAVAGWTVVRLTRRQLEREPAQIAGDLRALLGTGRRAAGE